MKRRVSLKKGTIYLLSASMLQMSAVPIMAENTVVESNTELETYAENIPDMTTASSATEPTTVLETVITTETENTVVQFSRRNHCQRKLLRRLQKPNLQQ